MKKNIEYIRLNKYIANSGICSRREADKLIKSGVIKVNGKIITQMGYKIDKKDIIHLGNEKISVDKKIYFLLNKPKGFISSCKDEKNRKTVMDIMNNASKIRMYSIGRLDRTTTGVLLFTNDGHLKEKLTHPKNKIKKVYHITLNKNLIKDDLLKIKNGVNLFPEGKAIVDNISFLNKKPHNEVGIELYLGWNRIIRRVFKKLDYEVIKLDRVSFANITYKNLKRGEFRELSKKEIEILKMM